MSISFIAKNIKVKRQEIPKEKSDSRFAFLDRTRGLIMIFMALDHALFFWSSGRVNNEGLPLLIKGIFSYNPIGSSGTLSLMVMFLASLCAPGFTFIAGYVLALSIQKRKSIATSDSSINKHLWRRGMILILLQVFIASPAFNLPMFLQTKSLATLTVGTFFSLSVLSAIGIGFFFLALGRRFSPWKLLGVSGLLYILSQLFLSSFARNFPIETTLEKTWQAILVLPVPFSTSLLVNNNFPVIPWILPMVLGWLYGHTYSRQRGLDYEAKRFAYSGLGSLALFFILRFAGIGDNLRPSGTFQSFFGLSKYPPSPDYFLFYLGIIFLLFFFFYKLPRTSKFCGILETFGQAPLFFYNVHLWLYAAVPAVLANFNGHSMGFGVGIWLIGLFILYPLCRGYLTWQASHKSRPPQARPVRESQLIH